MYKYVTVLGTIVATYFICTCFKFRDTLLKGGACLNRILNNQTVYMVIRFKLTTLQVVNLKA